MDKNILHPDVQIFINQHLNDDIKKLALSGNPFPEIRFSELLNQIASKLKAQNKLPTWFSTPGILYPPKLSIEQSSSEETAAYKASLVGGNQLVDATGGFGADSFFFSRQVRQVVHCEAQAELSGIAAHNFKCLGANVTCVNADSTDFIRSSPAVDWLYIDPARRHDVKGKIFRLQDATPDVTAHIDLYFSKAPDVLIKTSPMLDISAGLRQLPGVREIHVVALGNEVKEILWWLQRGFGSPPSVRAVNLPDAAPFSFVMGDHADVSYGGPGKFLYEPNAAIMKSGGFQFVGQKFGLKKLSKHAHLFTAENMIDTFPGRIFRIESQLPYRKDAMQVLANSKANVSTRHFPESVESIRKKWKIADGGDRYAFFTTDNDDQKIVLLCAKIRK